MAISVPLLCTIYRLGFLLILSHLQCKFSIDSLFPLHPVRSRSTICPPVPHLPSDYTLKCKQIFVLNSPILSLPALPVVWISLESWSELPTNDPALLVFGAGVCVYWAHTWKLGAPQVHIISLVEWSSHLLLEPGALTESWASLLLDFLSVANTASHLIYLVHKAGGGRGNFFSSGCLYYQGTKP